MTINEFLERTGATTKWLATKTGYTTAYVRAVKRGERGVRMQLDTFARFQWATKGALDPGQFGFESDAVPDLSQFPDPHDPEKTWLKDCAPIWERLRKKAVAEDDGENP